MSKALLGNAVVGGGTGFIGTHLCRALKNLGYGVTIMSRMPGPNRMTWNDLQCSGLPEGTTVVINLAGQNVLDFKQRWNSGFKQNVFNSRINTTKSLVQAIMQAQKKPGIFLTISGVGIYKPDKSKIYDEDTVEKEFDFFSTLCHKWENAAKIPGNSIRTVTIRSGVVIGRDGGMIRQLYFPFFLGLGGPVLPGDQFLPWIHMEDLINLMIFSIQNEKVTGVLNGVAPMSCTNRDFSSAFAKALRRPAILPLPQFVLNLLLSEERANMLTQGQKVIPKRTLNLGFTFKYPDIDSACNEVVKKR